MQLTYLQYDMLRIPVNVDGEKDAIDLGRVIMTPEGTRLESVEITAEIIPVVIRGDTIEYNAGAFDVQATDKVEDLLKKLPGVEVDEDGNIKAQGEDVEKILVDGKEFFGDDPKTASKNLPADAIDKVQVFDKMSEMSEFTGVDDGVRSRTINLALKDDRKTGYFGNVEGGYGTDDRFKAKANLNRFTPKSQNSFLGNANNTNEPAFSFRDYINFLGGFGRVMNQGGFDMNRGGMTGNVGIGANTLGVDFGQGINNSGIQTSAGAGLNINQDIGKKAEISGSYFYGYLQNDQDKSSFRETVTEDQPFITLADELRDDLNQSHNNSLYSKVELDSASQAVYRGSARINDAEGITRSNQVSRVRDDFENGLDQDFDNFQDLLNTSHSLLYRRRLKKPARPKPIRGCGATE